MKQVKCEKCGEMLLFRDSQTVGRCPNCGNMCETDEIINNANLDNQDDLDKQEQNVNKFDLSRLSQKKSFKPVMFFLIVIIVIFIYSALTTLSKPKNNKTDGNQDIYMQNNMAVNTNSTKKNVTTSSASTEDTLESFNQQFKGFTGNQSKEKVSKLIDVVVRNNSTNSRSYGNCYSK